MKYTCPVCGFPALHESPRSKGGGGSYEICPSCGFQFGVTDDDRDFTYDQWRAAWQQDGMKWSSHQAPPPKWNPAEQLANLTGKPTVPSQKPRRPRTNQ
jgi:hypothetical protein